MKSIFYKLGYKYQLSSPFSIATDITPIVSIFDGNFLCLDTDGTLHIDAGYAWDGPSGPAIDTDDFMRGSLVHDALYQLMRGDFIDEATWRERADNMLRKICLEDGMAHFRAEYVYQAVRECANEAADPKIEHQILQAPKDE